MMKKILLILLCLPMIGFGQQTYVPDDNFEVYLEANGMGDGILNDSVFTGNINSVTYLNVGGQSISDLTGIEDFSALEELNCIQNQLTSLDISNNIALIDLQCDNNQLTSLDVSSNIALTDLRCEQNLLTSIDVSGAINLTTLYCGNNYITSLYVSNNNALTFLDCYYNQLTSLDVSNNTALLELSCEQNLLTSIDVSGALNLISLSCNDNQLTTLDVSNNIFLTLLGCAHNQLTSLDVSNNTFLYYLYCYYNQLTSLDVSNNTALQQLEFISNQLTTLDVSSNTALQQLDCNNNQLTSIDLRNHSLQNLNLSTQTNPNLFCIDVDNPALAQVLLTNIDSWTSFDTNCVTALGCTDTLAYNYDSTATINDGSCYYGKTYVPDDNFEVYLEANGMGDGIWFNDSVSTGNINGVNTLNTGSINISDLTGIEDFTNLVNLDCGSNQITIIDVSNNIYLQSLEFHSNQVTSIDLSQNPALYYLECSGNNLISLDLSNNLALTQLSCTNNQLTSLDLSNHSLLGLTIETFGNQELLCIDVDTPLLAQSLYSSFVDPWTSFDTNCSSALGCTDTLAYNYDSTATINDGCYYGKTYVPDDNFEAYLEANGMGDGVMLNDSVLTAAIDTLTYLNVWNQNIADLVGLEDFTALTFLNCSTNVLTSLDVSQNSALMFLDCIDNQLTSLDVSVNTALQQLECIANQLTTLDVSNNTALQQLDCRHNQLTSLDLRNHTLQNLSFDTQNNPNLFCIDVDNPTLAQALLTNIDPWTSFDTNCITAFGCIDSTACNYIPNATIDDGSCTYLTVSLNNSQVICSNFFDATLTVNYNTGSYTYLWSNGEVTQSIDSLAMGNYSVIVTDTAGCSATLSANVTLAPAPAFNMFPEICYVTVDSTTGNNKVIIKPMANLLTSKFIIYKESSANIYSPIDTMNINVIEYLDISSNPMAQSYRYKVSVLDTCGNESVKSNFHKTIHLTMSLGINGEINLLWNAYEGYQPSDYLIFRSINNGSMSQIGILPGTNLAYTDLTPPSGNLNYQVRAIAPNCNIIPFAKKATNMFVSNVIIHNTTDVDEIIKSKKILKVTDLLGRETKQTNQPLFYIYDDGTVEKRIVIE